MSENYDNWEKLVNVALRRVQFRQLALAHSRESSSSTLNEDIMDWERYYCRVPSGYGSIFSRSVKLLPDANKKDIINIVSFFTLNQSAKHSGNYLKS
ncbi:Hypothetical predicted protein [Olea europaea subsp. europaea]|uniref:Uncharacterized protein n=1 Tax=Olea europaea subsp. europaea TaxID=158383 RepID=A0A8S0V903_OLEEU|nr:Hypothetical predicted protein [Olea europaea subsp. europaea]